MLLPSDQTTILLLAFLVQRKTSQSTRPIVCNDRTQCFWTMISLSIVSQATTLAKQMHCPLISSHHKLQEDTVLAIISMEPEFVSCLVSTVSALSVTSEMIFPTFTSLI